MQDTTSLRFNGGFGAQALRLAIVGLLGLGMGLGVGRWVVPATDSAPAASQRLVETSTSGLSSEIMSRKLTQMDASDNSIVAAVSEQPAGDNLQLDPASASDGHVIGVKFAQMDAADGSIVTAVSPAGESLQLDPESASEGHIIRVKFGQMDALDAALPGVIR